MALAEFIQDNMEAILHEWEKFAETMPPAVRMDRKALRNEAEQILHQIADDMCQPETREQQETKSKSRKFTSAPSADTTAASHARMRHREGFDLNEMAAEYRALRATVVRLWTKDMESADAETLYELTRFNEAIDETWIEAIARYGEELQRSRELLLGVLGHDLRTPLSAVLMSARLLSDYGDLNERNANAVGRILNSATHIENMISALLDVTRMRLGGSLPIHSRSADLSDICPKVVEEIRAAHPRRQIELETIGDLQGRWDEGRLIQMLSNLLSNAIQHGAQDRPVSLSASAEDDQVLLSVHNEGKVIPEATMEQLFEPMTQTSYEQDKSKGLGLGLYIARAIAESHGGRIDVKSVEQQGTSFNVHLPRDADALQTQGTSRSR